MAKDTKVKISKLPTQGVSGLGTPARDGYKLTASWKYGKKCFDEKLSDRFEGVLARWYIDTDMSESRQATNKVKIKTGTDKNKKPTYAKVTRESYTSTNSAGGFVTYTLKGEKKTSSTFEFPRANYYPFGHTSQVYKVRLYSISGKKLTKTKTVKSLYENDYNYYKANKALFANLKAAKTAVKNGKYQALLKSKSVGVYEQQTTEKQAQAYVDGIGVRVEGWNSKSGKTWRDKAPIQSAYFNFYPPAPPTTSLNKPGEVANHVVQATIKAPNDNTGAKERYDTVVETTYTYGKRDKNPGDSRPYRIVSSGGKITSKSSSFTAEESTVTVNPNTDIPGMRSGGITGLLENEYLRVTVKAYNRGIAGDSGYGQEQTFLFAYPNDVYIVGNIIDTDDQFYIKFEPINPVSGLNASGLKVSAVANAVRFTEGYTLQRKIVSGSPENERVKWTDDRWMAEAKKSSGWDDVYAIGTNERAFVDSKTNAIGDGTYDRTYYRVRAWNNIDFMPAQYSDPVLCPVFNRIPSAVNEEVEFLEAEGTSDGKSIRAVLTWDVSYNELDEPNSDTNQITWDPDIYAWKSTNPPTPFNMLDEDFIDSVLRDSYLEREEFRSKVKDNVGEVYIRGLDESTPYYLKARRYLSTNETHGKWADYNAGTSAVTAVVPASNPGVVNLTAPTFVAKGKDFSVSWTYESDSTQTAWELLYGEGLVVNTDVPPKEITPPEGANPRQLEYLELVNGTYVLSQDTTVDPSKTYYKADQAKVELSSPKHLAGENSATGYYVIKYSDIEDKLQNGSLYLAVKIRTSGSWATSKGVSVREENPPVAGINVNDTLDAQPLVFTIKSNTANTDATITVVSDYVTNWTPLGDQSQPSGSAVWSSKFSPEWLYDSEASEYYYNVTLPRDLAFYDNGKYTVSLTLTDKTTNLTSDIVDATTGEVSRVSKTFGVQWAHQAAAPSYKSYAINIPGTNHVQIHLAKPDIGCLESDVCDVYRVTPDGAYLVARGAKFEKDIIDKYAPYSKYALTRYRLCTRTLDGDIDWIDIAYRSPGYAIRFDWGSDALSEHGFYNYVEVPFNLKMSDAFTKNVRIQSHLDGQVQAYWREGYQRKASLSTVVLKFTDTETINRIRALAEYPGAVFVRTPDGCAYTAHVEVNNIGNNYDTQVLEVSFNATEIAMAPEFWIELEDDQTVMPNVEYSGEGEQTLPDYDETIDDKSEEEPKVVPDDPNEESEEDQEEPESSNEVEES